MLFTRRAPDLGEWPDPHAGRPPSDEEYSRQLDPAKWRVLIARAEAWSTALVEAGAARREVVQVDDLVWVRAPGTVLTCAARLIPAAPGALPLIVARTRMLDVDDVGLTLGVGGPATVLGSYPHCGCDACDRGSQDELDRVDDAFGAVVTGTPTGLHPGASGTAWLP